MKPEVLLPIGLPASGKSTFAKEWLKEDPDARIRVNYDELRAGMFGEGWVWNRQEEEAMKAQARGIVTKALKAGLSVVIDNTNLSAGVRESWRQMAIQHHATYAEQDIPTNVATCIARDRMRTGRARVGQAVIDNMALRYGYLDFSSTRPMAVCDIDGTVADDRVRLKHLQEYCSQCNELWEDEYGRPLVGNCIVTGHPHIKHKKNWQAYFREVPNDLPIQRMINLLERLHDHLIVFISGRPINDGPSPVGIWTEDWLLKHGIAFDRLFLKGQNTHQKSVDFKREILEYLPKDRISYVFEDDPRCVEMYRKELPGALVAHVAERLIP